jgi:hypothetical protein
MANLVVRTVKGTNSALRAAKSEKLLYERGVLREALIAAQRVK